MSNRKELIELFLFPFLIFFSILQHNFVVSHEKWTYPNVRRDESFSYERFGVKIPDPYHWLEDPKSEETSLFIKQQNNLTDSFLRQTPNRESIKSNFRELFNYTEYGIPSKHGNKYYMTIRKPSQNHSVFYSLKSLDDDNPQVFLDPNAFSNDGTVSLAFVSFSPDGKWLAYGFSSSGSDWITIKFKNADTLVDLNEKLVKVKFLAGVWNENSQGFFYTYYDDYDGPVDGTETSVPEYQKLYYHKLNTSQDQDLKVAEFPDQPKLILTSVALSQDGRQIHLFPTNGGNSQLWLFSEFDPNFDSKFKFEFKYIVDKFEYEHRYVADTKDCVYILTNYKAKNFRVVCVDLSCPSRDDWKEVIPNKKNLLSAAMAVNQDYLVCVYTKDAIDEIQIYNLTTGQYLFKVDTPAGTISIGRTEIDSTEFFFQIVSFSSPGIIYHYDFKSLVIKPFENVFTHKLSVYKQSIIEGLNMDDYQTEQVFYTSKDGTKVPMFIFRRKKLAKNGKNPTILTAYGGFKIIMKPQYNPMAIFFAKNLNGIFALANIRGGGEYGDDWHEQGMLLNKQNVFDDFASAGEWLIRKRYTSRKFLTANGRSNGGLLAGVISNQRPDIFGSSIPEVGVLDMLKFPLFTIGYAWIPEYGDPVNNETDFRNILKYSPLHNIPENPRKYPNILVMTADHDNRVVPAHSFKFISELQYKLSKKLSNVPMMIKIDSNAGHGKGRATSKLIEASTNIICFLLNSTPYKYRP